MKKILHLFLIILLLFSLSCEKIKKIDEKISSKEILSINGKVYTEQDLWDFSNMSLREMSPQDLVNPEIKEKILNDFIEHKLLLAEAELKGIQIDQLKLKEYLNEFDTAKGKEELRAITGYYEIDNEKYTQILKERILIDMLFQQVINSNIIVTESELKEYYNKHGINRSPVGVAHIMHIFSTKEEVIKAALADLRKGLTFNEVAEKYSESPEAKDGGDLGFINENDYPEFFKVAFKLKEGEISPIIESEYGFHIFKMVQYAKADRASYSTNKTAIMAKLYAQKREEQIRELVNALYSKADIQFLYNFNLAELFPKKR